MISADGCWRTYCWRRRPTSCGHHHGRPSCKTSSLEWWQLEILPRWTQVAQCSTGSAGLRRRSRTCLWCCMRLYPARGLWGQQLRERRTSMERVLLNDVRIAWWGQHTQLSVVVSLQAAAGIDAQAAVAPNTNVQTLMASDGIGIQVPGMGLCWWNGTPSLSYTRIKRMDDCRGDTDTVTACRRMKPKEDARAKMVCVGAIISTHGWMDTRMTRTFIRPREIPTASLVRIWQPDRSVSRVVQDLRKHGCTDSLWRPRPAPHTNSGVLALWPLSSPLAQTTHPMPHVSLTCSSDGVIHLEASVP